MDHPRDGGVLRPREAYLRFEHSDEMCDHAETWKRLTKAARQREDAYRDGQRSRKAKIRPLLDAAFPFVAQYRKANPRCRKTTAAKCAANRLRKAGHPDIAKNFFRTILDNLPAELQALWTD